jgi:hypothetical protein
MMLSLWEVSSSMYSLHASRSWRISADKHFLFASRGLVAERILRNLGLVYGKALHPSIKIGVYG